MKMHEKIAVRLCQILPDKFVPDPFKEYCVSVAVRDLEEKKQQLIQQRWKQNTLECQLAKLKAQKK